MKNENELAVQRGEIIREHELQTQGTMSMKTQHIKKEKKSLVIKEFLEDHDA